MDGKKKPSYRKNNKSKKRGAPQNPSRNDSESENWDKGVVGVSPNGDGCEAALENDQVQSRKNFEATLQDFKHANRDLHASNDQNQAINDELRAANEEMQASREELQSINEEVNSVNDELLAKIKELENANNDLSNFLSCTNIPTLFLDLQGNVRRFTPAMIRLTGLLPSDIGRPLADMVQQQLGHDLLADARAVLDRLFPVTREISNKDAFYDRTTMPYRRLDGRTGGVVITYIDITERKKTSERMAFQADLLANISDVVYATDLQMRVTSWNNAAERMYGWKEAEALGKSVFEVTYSKFNPTLRDRLREQLLEKGSVKAEIEHETRSGRVVIFESTTMVLRDPAGEATGFVGINHDITEQKKVETTLRESEARFRTIAETMPALISLSSLEDSVILFVNSAYCKAFEYSKEDIIGRKGPDVYFDPDDRTKMLDAIREQGFVENYQIRARKNDGTPFWILSSVRPIVYDGKPAIIGASIDLTIRKEAEEALRAGEEKYRTLFETMTEGFSLDELIFDEKGNPCDLRYLMVNPAFERQTGLKAKDITGKTTLELFPEAEPVWFEQYGKVVLTGEPVQFEEKFGPLERWFHVNAFRTGAVTFAVVFTDITERKAAEEVLRRHAAELTAANQSLEAFAYSISHDLRNPLNAILGCSEVAKESIPLHDADGRKALDFITRSAQRMALIISDLMSLAKVTNQEVCFKKCNLSTMAQSIADELSTLEPGRKVAIGIEPGLVAVADEGLIWMLMQNLFHNAWKFTANTSNARIEFGRREDEKSTFYFVRDNGVGFDMAQVERLFKPFQRLHSGLEYFGTGIGLIIVKRIVEKHGGTVWAEGEKDKGTAIYFEIPEAIDIRNMGGVDNSELE